MPKVVPEYKQEARNRIIRASIQAFSEKGYDDTTMDDIAKLLGVSKGAIYLYFKSKEELFREISKIELETLKEVIRSSFDGKHLIEDSPNLFDKIQEQMILSPRLNFELLSKALRNTNLSKLLKKAHEEIIAIIEGFIEGQKEKGLIEPNVDSRALALALIALANGLPSMLVSGYDKSEIKQAWRELLKVIGRGLSTKN